MVRELSPCEEDRENGPFRSLGGLPPTAEAARIAGQKPILAPRVNMFELRLIVETPLALASPRIL